MSSNYAWANPSTGIREQSNSKEEARLLVWREIQEASPAPEEAGISVIVYEQEPAGKASKENCTLDNPTDGMSWDGYAFANPSDGMRESYSVFIDAANRIAEQWPEHAPMESVVIYRQREAFRVYCDDPEPAPLIAAEIPLDTPSSLIDQVMEGTCADLQRASLLASLWIAQSLQEVAGALHYMSPVAQKEPEPEAPPETPEPNKPSADLKRGAAPAAGGLFGSGVSGGASGSGSFCATGLM